MGWEKNRLKAKITELQKTIDNLEKEIKALKKAQEKLRADSLDAALISTSSHSKALAESDAKTAAAAQKVADLEAEFEGLNGMIEQYETTFKLVGEQNKQLLDLLHASENRVEKLVQQEHEIAAAEIKELKRKLDGTSWQSTARLEAKQALEREYEVLRQQVSSLHTANSNLQQQINTLQTTTTLANANQNNRTKIHSNCSGPPALRRELQVLNLENARLKQLLTTQESKLENAQAKIVLLESDSKDYETEMRRAQRDARRAIAERDRLRVSIEELCDDDNGSQRTEDYRRDSLALDQQNQTQRLLRVERRLDQVRNGMWGPRRWVMGAAADD